MPSTTELLLHPVRLRVLQLLVGDQQLTTAQLAEQLPDVPTATLYRQVARLVEAGILVVVGERQVRGAVERTYGVDLRAVHVGAEDAAAMSAEEHRAAFTAFVAGLLAGFDRYLAGPGPDPAADRVGYRQTTLWLTDEELDELAAEVREAVARRQQHPPGQGRRRRSWTTVVLPADRA